MRTPKRWDRIADLARQLGVRVPADADSVALDALLVPGGLTHAAGAGEVISFAAGLWTLCISA